MKWCTPCTICSGVQDDFYQNGTLHAPVSGFPGFRTDKMVHCVHHSSDPQLRFLQEWYTRRTNLAAVRQSLHQNGARGAPITPFFRMLSAGMVHLMHQSSGFPTHPQLKRCTTCTDFADIQNHSHQNGTLRAPISRFPGFRTDKMVHYVHHSSDPQLRFLQEWYI